jgi:aspartate ammonia-lyase
MRQRPGWRIERDLLGDLQVPSEAPYGIQTWRAVKNFPTRGQRTIGDFPWLVEGLLRVKQAAALVNGNSGLLNLEVAQAIQRVAGRVLVRPRHEHFPVHHLHGGGGTSANMNANEVLANLAEEALGGRRGEYRRVHPNDHVNLNQSTNDVYPTACHIAVILAWPSCERALKRLATGLQRKAQKLRKQKRLARTCLQDAVAISYGDCLGGYASFVRRGLQRVAQSVDALHAVNLGGSIVGRESDVPATYFRKIIPALRRVTRDRRYVRAGNLFDSAQNLDDLARVSGDLDLLARGLTKIAQDFRLLGSGPEGGLGELRLPAVQPGSSIMPGKVNPVIPEHVIQLCFRVMGLNASCQVTLDHGELDLNVWESVAVFAVLESMELLAAAADGFEARCVRRLDVDAERSARHAETIIPWLTDLAARHGYSRVTDVCKRAKGNMAELRVLLAATFPATRRTSVRRSKNRQS